MESLGEERHTIRKTPKRHMERMCVPDMSDMDLLLHCSRLRPDMEIDPRLLDWEFMREERGKEFFVLTFQPTSVQCLSYIRSMLKLRGYRGSTAAFLSWIAATQPQRSCTTLPDEGEEWFEPYTTLRYTPSFIRDDAGVHVRLLRMGAFHVGNLCRPMYVAFRDASFPEPLKKQRSTPAKKVG